jgi:predicted transcriptional regulator
MNENRILFELAEKGKTSADIAIELKVSGSAVSQVIHREMKSKNIRDYICSIIGKTFDEVWGDDEKGTKIENDRDQKEG